MRPVRLWATMVVLVVVAGCVALERDKAADARASAMFDLVRVGAFKAAAGLMTSQFNTPEAVAQIAAIGQIIPDSPANARRTVGVETRQQGSTTEVLLTDEYVYPDQILRVTTGLIRTGDGASWLVQSFHVNGATKEQLAANNFLRARGLPQYLFFGLLAASVGTMIAAFIKVIRARGLKRKWLWCIVALVGVAAFRMDWTSGQYRIDPFSLNLIGAGVMRANSAFASWVLSWTFPIGALLILTGVWANPARARKPRTAEIRETIDTGDR